MKDVRSLQRRRQEVQDAMPSRSDHARPGTAIRRALLLVAGALAAGALGLGLRAFGRPHLAAPPALPIAATGSAVTASEALPAFALPMLGGGQLTAADLKDRPVVLNFFASWCPSCWVEIPHLARVYDEHRRRGLVVVGVGVLDSEESLRWMVTRLRIPYPTAYDSSGETVVRILQLRAMPTTLFVDRQGRVRIRWQGLLDETTLRDLVGQIL
jgi:peroxiredoxin